MPLLLLTLIALLQWGIVILLPNTPSDFNPTTFLYGNLQIIVILWFYRVITKYINVSINVTYE